ncbi:MAG TPA: O-acetyl-ADP-ribose deacetylase, partial [Firmicutes bacterium]|nr:O-acetyl-ADP-ribose deacetylase [Bacillota bacterium]
IALETVRQFARDNPGLDEIRFVLFTDRDLKVYEGALEEILAR